MLPDWIKENPELLKKFIKQKKKKDKNHINGFMVYQNQLRNEIIKDNQPELENKNVDKYFNFKTDIINFAKTAAERYCLLVGENLIKFQKWNIITRQE